MIHGFLGLTGPGEMNAPYFGCDRPFSTMKTCAQLLFLEGGDGQKCLVEVDAESIEVSLPPQHYNSIGPTNKEVSLSQLATTPHETAL